MIGPVWEAVARVPCPQYTRRRLDFGRYQALNNYHAQGYVATEVINLRRFTSSLAIFRLVRVSGPRRCIAMSRNPVNGESDVGMGNALDISPRRFRWVSRFAEWMA